MTDSLSGPPAVVRPTEDERSISGLVVSANAAMVGASKAIEALCVELAAVRADHAERVAECARLTDALTAARRTNTDQQERIAALRTALLNIAATRHEADVFGAHQDCWMIAGNAFEADCEREIRASTPTEPADGR